MNEKEFKVMFYQSTDAMLSINLLFDIVKKNLPASLQFSTRYFRYKSASLIDRLRDIVEVFSPSRKNINHVTGDFNYATFLMPRKNTILTIHDLYRLYRYKGNPLKSRFFQLLWLKIPIKKSAVVTAISQHTKEEILRFSNCPESKIRVIYNCINPAFTPAPKKFNKERPVLLQIGTRENKNIEKVIEAIKGIPCRLDIVGNPSGKLIGLLKEYKIHYTLAGKLSQQALIQKYEEADMLLFVSTYEGFGMPIIEANTVERAVVASDISAIPEIAANAACYVNPFDANSIREGIMKVINDDNFRENLLAAGRINKERFTPQKISNQYATLYKEVYALSHNDLVAG